MIRTTAIMFAAVIAAGATALPAKATSQVSGSGAALNVQLFGLGNPINKLNQVYSYSSALPLNEGKKATVANGIHILKLAPGLTLKLTTTSVASTSKAGPSGSSLAAAGISQMKDLKATLSGPAGPIMALDLSQLTSSALFKLDKAGIGRKSAKFELSKVTINAPAFGIKKTTTFTPPASADNILYQTSDGAIRIYTNRELYTGNLSDVTGLQVNAFEILFNNFKYGTALVSGDISIGVSIAKEGL